jgi:hypothetical protein
VEHTAQRADGATRADVERAREATRGVACPRCKAPAGELCRRVNGQPRKMNHAARLHAARDEGLVGVGRKW